MLGNLHSSQGFCAAGVQWGSGHCSCRVRGILTLARRAGRCEQLLRQVSHSSWPCLWINSSGEVTGGKALPYSLDVFLKAQGQLKLHQLRSRGKEVTSLLETRTSFTAFGTKSCSIQSHGWWLPWMGRWCHRYSSSMEMELDLCLVALEHCKCFVASSSVLDNLKGRYLLISRSSESSFWQVNLDRKCQVVETILTICHFLSEVSPIFQVLDCFSLKTSAKTEQCAGHHPETL